MDGLITHCFGLLTPNPEPSNRKADVALPHAAGRPTDVVKTELVDFSKPGMLEMSQKFGVPKNLLLHRFHENQPFSHLGFTISQSLAAKARHPAAAAAKLWA